MLGSGSLPRKVHFELLPAAFEPYGSSGWFPSRPPAPESIRRIEDSLSVRLPSLLVEIALACPSYGGWFGSIGDDIESHNHMLTINREFHEAGLPSRYVLLNHGHDGDCDGWDLQGAAGPDGQRPIIYFQYDLDTYFGDQRITPKVTDATFAGYLDRYVRAHAVRCPDDNLRRRARRTLAEWQKTL